MGVTGIWKPPRVVYWIFQLVTHQLGSDLLDGRKVIEKIHKIERDLLLTTILGVFYKIWGHGIIVREI